MTHRVPFARWTISSSAIPRISALFFGSLQDLSVIRRHFLCRAVLLSPAVVASRLHGIVTGLQDTHPHRCLHPILSLLIAPQVSNNPTKAEEYLRRADEIEESAALKGQSTTATGRLDLMGPSEPLDATSLRETVRGS